MRRDEITKIYTKAQQGRERARNKAIMMVQEPIYMQIDNPKASLTACLTDCINSIAPIPQDVKDNRQWKEHAVKWDATITGLDKEIIDLHAQLLVVLKTRTDFDGVLLERKKAIDRLSDVNRPLAKKLKIIQNNPYESLVEKYRDLNLSDEQKQVLVKYDPRYLCLIEITKRDEIIDKLDDPETSLHDMQDAIIRYQAISRLPREVSDKLSSGNKGDIDAKNLKILDLIRTHMRVRHKTEVEKREATLKTFESAMLQFSDKINLLMLEIGKKEVALNELKEEVVPVVDPLQIKIDAATHELETLKLKHAVAVAVKTELHRFSKTYTSDHTVSLKDFKENCRGLLSGDDATIKVQIANEDGELVETEYPIKGTLCQQRDEWSFKGVMEYLLKSVGWESGARFFQPDSANKLGGIEASVENLKSPGLGMGGDGDE